MLLRVLGQGSASSSPVGSLSAGRQKCRNVNLGDGNKRNIRSLEFQTSPVSRFSNRWKVFDVIAPTMIYSRTIRDGPFKSPHSEGLRGFPRPRSLEADSKRSPRCQSISMRIPVKRFVRRPMGELRISAVEDPGLSRMILLALFTLAF